MHCMPLKLEKNGLLSSTNKAGHLMKTLSMIQNLYC